MSPVKENPTQSQTIFVMKLRSLLPQAVSKHVMSRDFILKANKKSKGSHT